MSAQSSVAVQVQRMFVWCPSGVCCQQSLVLRLSLKGTMCNKSPKPAQLPKPEAKFPSSHKHTPARKDAKILQIQKCQRSNYIWIKASAKEVGTAVACMMCGTVQYFAQH